MSRKKVILIGLHPDSVDFDKWPDLSPEKLTRALESERASLESSGFSAEVCLVDRGETAESVVRDKLAQETFDCVIIGAGVRRDDDHFLLFEKLVNLVHSHAPDAAIAFNTNPSDSADAVKRWIEP
ncbi:hypothetical protein [Minwuia sp.]|uniref:hypothetical protein n=1 Tax=Minwuia sp. TaxID=2493630 RepID=UPI003A8CFFC1